MDFLENLVQNSLESHESYIGKIISDIFAKISQIIFKNMSVSDLLLVNNLKINDIIVNIGKNISYITHQYDKYHFGYILSPILLANITNW